jgi:CubicO group peptidase (beta-lactamase class C family)
VFPGCTIGVLRNATCEIFPFGHFTYNADSPKVERETIYDLASITKSIPTASLCALFIDAGKIRLNDSAKKYIPELQNDRDATIEDLLRYRVKGPRMSVLNFKTFEQIRTHIFENGFDGPPGKEEYTNLPAYLLGIIIERVGGGSLAALSHHYLFKPLEMEHTTYFPSVSDCAPTEMQYGETILGVPHDESARVFAHARRSCGHAGLFSTAQDLLTYSEAMLMSKMPFDTIGQAAENGLGWAVNQDWFMGTHASKKAFGKTGFTGTSIVIDRAKKTALVILSNRCYPTRPLDAASLTSAVNIFRRDIADIVFA